MKNHYEILGLEPNASVEDIKQAYRKLSLKFHPDKNNGEVYFAAMFRQINEAYQILSDPKKRKDYDNQRLNSEQSLLQQRKLIEQKEQELKLREQALNRQTYKAETYEPDSSVNIANAQSLNYIVGLKYCLWVIIVLMIFLLSNKSERSNSASFDRPVPQSARHKHRHVKKTDKKNPRIRTIPDTTPRTDTLSHVETGHSDSSLSSKDTVK